MSIVVLVRSVYASNDRRVYLIARERIFRLCIQPKCNGTSEAVRSELPFTCYFMDSIC